MVIVKNGICLDALSADIQIIKKEELLKILQDDLMAYKRGEKLEALFRKCWEKGERDGG